MRHKEPKVVITDGDESMRKAIKNFCVAFKTTVYGHFDVEEFDNYWVDMVTSFSLEDNDWITKTYKKREMWANAYFGGKFCVGIQTTSQCKDINSSLKKFIKSRNCLLELVQNLDRVVKNYWNNEFIADYKTLYSNLVMTICLETLERSASKLCMREIFYEVQKQIERVATLLVLHRDSIGSIEKFMFRKFSKALSCVLDVLG
ncbi:hypothetical protein AHAS_Ahas20G0277500 [Arachis hypogaea]